MTPHMRPRLSSFPPSHARPAPRGSERRVIGRLGNGVSRPAGTRSPVRLLRPRGEKHEIMRTCAERRDGFRPENPRLSVRTLVVADILRDTRSQLAFVRDHRVVPHGQTRAEISGFLGAHTRAHNRVRSHLTPTLSRGSRERGQSSSHPRRCSRANRRAHMSCLERTIHDACLLGEATRFTVGPAAAASWRGDGPWNRSRCASSVRNARANQRP